MDTLLHSPLCSLHGICKRYQNIPPLLPHQLITIPSSPPSPLLACVQDCLVEDETGHGPRCCKESNEGFIRGVDQVKETAFVGCGKVSRPHLRLSFYKSLAQNNSYNRKVGISTHTVKFEMLGWNRMNHAISQGPGPPVDVEHTVGTKE